MSTVSIESKRSFPRCKKRWSMRSASKKKKSRPRPRCKATSDAESIDFLDIVFRLEKAFDIKIERGELFPEDILTNTEYVEDGKVNAAGIAKLKERMPFADLSQFEADPNVQNLGKQLTVQDMCNFVEHKLAA